MNDPDDDALDLVADDAPPPGPVVRFTMNPAKAALFRDPKTGAVHPRHSPEARKCCPH